MYRQEDNYPGIAGMSIIFSTILRASFIYQFTLFDERMLRYSRPEGATDISVNDRVLLSERDWGQTMRMAGRTKAVFAALARVQLR